MCRLLLRWAIFALGTVVVFTCPIDSSVRCSPCSTTGVLSFNVSVDGNGQKANVTCCPLDGFQTGVYLQRNNGSNVNRSISYLPRDGHCDRFAMPLTELHCSFYLVCRSAPTGSNKTKEVRITVKDVVSSFTNLDPFSSEIDVLQYCQCSQIKVDVTSSTSLSSTVDKLREMTTMTNLLSITAKSKGRGDLTPVVGGTIVILILILAALLIALIVALAWKRNKMSKAQIVQSSSDEQQENKPLVALYRIITSHTHEIDPNSSQVESPPSRVELQPFVLTKEFEPSDLSRTTAEGEQYSAVQCTNASPGSSGVVFYDGKDLIQPKPGSMTFAMTFIPDGTSV